MRYHGEYHEVLGSFNSKYYILDSSIKKITIYEEDHEFCIDVHFVLIQRNKSEPEMEMKLHFTGINQYCFNNDHTRYPYYVERCKFFESPQGYYFSTDPYDESREISDLDNDVILAKKIEVYLI